MAPPAPLFFTSLLENFSSSVFNYSLSSFRYEPGVTPLSTWPSVISALLGYFAVISLLHGAMKQAKAPLQLKHVFAAHNGILSLVSLVLLVALAESIFPHVARNGLHWGVCSQELFQDPRLEQFYYVNYVIKFVELLDTVFLVLKKKPLTFLHVFHHSMTALLCFTQLNGKTTVQWVPIVLNLFVHVLMYYYYFVSALSVSVWWKKHLTTLQIIQFVIDLVACYYCLFTRFGHNYYGEGSRDCHGDVNAAYFGCALLTSYLFLFIDFFRRTYQDGARKKKTQ